MYVAGLYNVYCCENAEVYESIFGTWPVIDGVVEIVKIIVKEGFVKV